MPGFFVGNSGGFPGSPSNTVETRRQHRWAFRYIGRGMGGSFTPQSLVHLKTASRPNFKFEKPEKHYNQEVSYYAGKQTWEPMKLEWYDVEQDPDVSSEIYGWLETVVNFTTANVNPPAAYKVTTQLATLNGAGGDSERWTTYGSWPSNVDWKELDMTSTELLTISVEVTYDRAIKECFSATPAQYVGPTCSA